MGTPPPLTPEQNDRINRRLDAMARRGPIRQALADTWTAIVFIGFIPFIPIMAAHDRWILSREKKKKQGRGR